MGITFKEELRRKQQGIESNLIHKPICMYCYFFLFIEGSYFFNLLGKDIFRIFKKRHFLQTQKWPKVQIYSSNLKSLSHILT